MNQHTKRVSSSKKYQNIFFDLDGTLADPKEGITKCIQYALQKLGILAPSSDELEWCIGPPLMDVFACLGKNSSEIFLSEALKHFRERFTQRGMYENVLYPGINEMLLQLHQDGFKLFIATSKPQHFAIKILDHFKLSHLFENIYGCELDETRSDKSHLLKHILESGSISGKSIMIGDRKFDVIAAIENGMDHLGVTYGYGSIEELRNANVNHLCHSPADIYHWIHS